MYSSMNYDNIEKVASFLAVWNRFRGAEPDVCLLRLISGTKIANRNDFMEIRLVKEFSLKARLSR